MNFAMRLDPTNPFAAFVMHRIAAKVKCEACQVGPGEQCVNIFSRDFRRATPHDSRLHAASNRGGSTVECKHE